MIDDTKSTAEQHPRWISESLIETAVESSAIVSAERLDRNAAIGLLQRLSQLLNAMGLLELGSDDEAQNEIHGTGTSEQSRAGTGRILS